MTKRLEGKVVFITGAARGQGRAHAVRFAEEGADVIGLDICADIPSTGYPLGSHADLEETVALVEKQGRRMVAGIGDVRDSASIAAVLDQGLAEFGGLNFAVANAGIMPTFGERANELRAWQDSIDVLLTGVMFTVEACYPHLIEQGPGGAIVITSSMAATQPMMRTLGGKTLGLLGYSAAKAAVLNLMQNYASVLADEGIRVNAVQPTGVNTPMVQNDMMQSHWATANQPDLQVLINALGVHSVEPEDIANAALWLCTDDARYLTGTALRVDAGASLR